MEQINIEMVKNFSPTMNEIEIDPITGLPIKKTEEEKIEELLKGLEEKKPETPTIQ